LPFFKEKFKGKIPYIPPLSGEVRRGIKKNDPIPPLIPPARGKIITLNLKPSSKFPRTRI